MERLWVKSVCALRFRRKSRQQRVLAENMGERGLPWGVSESVERAVRKRKEPTVSYQDFFSTITFQNPRAQCKACSQANHQSHSRLATARDRNG